MNDHESRQPEIVTDTDLDTDRDTDRDTGHRPRRHRWIAVQLKTVAAADVIAWLDVRLAGEPATPGCTANLK